MNKYLELVGYARPVYRKCELCKRVKDVSYRLDVKNAETSAMLTGSLDLCKHCAANWGEIIRKGQNMDIFKMIMDQAAGVAIAILLIMRIETKLDGLTNAVIKLSEAIRPTGNDSLQTHDQSLYLCKWKKSKNF